MAEASEALFLGGRSGAGKTSVGYEIHAQLSAARVPHCLIDGDNLDMAYPPPQEHGLAERNLAAIWANYRVLGYHRMIYVNTASVLGDVTSRLTVAMGDDPSVTAVLLTCSDSTAHQRLTGREKGTELRRHIQRSDLMARELNLRAPGWVHRLETDDRAISDLAVEVISLAKWTPHSPSA
jgi:Adenylylsulphate kinase